MKRHTILILLSIVLTLSGCGSDQTGQSKKAAVNTIVEGFPGDSTVYGLACDGCTDTLLVVLTNLENDPDTFDVLNTMLERKVFGRPRTGDIIAIKPNAELPGTADVVINLSRLQGTWCYMVTPQLKRRAGVSDEAREHFLRNMPDSVKQRLMQPREYGFELKGDFVAQPVGGRSNRDSDDNGPVKYPKMKRYRQWQIVNGHLVLNEMRRDTAGVQQVVSSDTADILSLRRDTLQLRFTNGTEQTYYRKQEQE